MRCTANPGGSGAAWVKKRYIEPTPPGETFMGKDGVVRKFIPAPNPTSTILKVVSASRLRNFSCKRLPSIKTCFASAYEPFLEE